MAGSPAPPPPPPLKYNSSAPAFKSNTSGPSTGHEPAQGSSTSPAAAALPVPVPSDALVAVIGVVGKLSARGLLTGFEIPEAGLTDEGASALFDGVLTAFLAGLGDPEAASCLPIPSPPLVDGRKVELVRLFLAVRARGGFFAVESWADVAEAVGLDPTADTAVKLLYGKYLALLEQNVLVCSGNADLLLGSKKGRFLSPTKLPTTTSAGSVSLKRKRDALPVPSDALLVVLRIVGELSARGLLAGFEIPEAGLTNDGASALFDGVLRAFLAGGLGDPAAASCLPIPPPPLGDGRKVELVRLYLAVRARGGFFAVESWADVAEAVGLDPTADTAVKLLYGKYLALLEQNLLVCSGNADLLLDSMKRKFLSPTKLLTTTSARSVSLKRKRDALVGMLDWVRLVATNPGKQAGKNPGGHKQAVVELRRQMFADKDCLAREELGGMLNWVRTVATSAGQPGIIGMNSPPPDHLSTAVELRSQMSVVAMLDWVRHVATSPAEPEVMEENSLSYRSAALLFRSKKFADKKYSRSSASAASPQSGIPLRPCGQADIPEWTGKPSSYYDDPRTLRFLGEPILLPESNEDLDGASIGKGRQDDCNCEYPGSIACVRLHVAEKKMKLKQELGSAYFEMGFHRIGEDLALAWTKDEERKFNTTIQNSLPSSTNIFWDKLLAVLHDKGREGLVSYYHNVFQVWRRAYQNRLTQKADSDDDSIEPGFLYARQASDQSRSKQAGSSSSRKRRRS